jgi:hypothetical protein
MVTITTISGTIYEGGVEIPFTYTITDSDKDWVDVLEVKVKEAIEASLIS